MKSGGAEWTTLAPGVTCSPMRQTRKWLLALIILLGLSSPSEGSIGCGDLVFRAAILAQSFHPAVRGISSLAYGALNFWGGTSRAHPPIEYTIALGLIGYSFEDLVIAEVKDGNSMFVDLVNQCYGSSRCPSGLLVNPADLDNIPLPDNSADLILSLKLINPTEANLRELLRIAKPNSQIRFTLSQRQVSLAKISHARAFLATLPEVRETDLQIPINPFNGRLLIIKLGQK